MDALTDEDVLGAVDDLGQDVQVGSATLRGILRSSYVEAQTGLGVEESHDYLVMSESAIDAAGLKKGMSINTAGTDYRVKRIERTTPGVVRVQLSSP